MAVRRPRNPWPAAAALTAGCAATTGAGLALLCSGSLPDRIGALTESAGQFLAGFLELPYDARSLGVVLPAFLTLSTAGWIVAGCSTLAPKASSVFTLLPTR